MKLCVAAVAIAAGLAVAPAAHAATLVVDPARACYRERETVYLPGSGFTAGARVDFSRDEVPLPVEPPILADPAGNVSATLTLPELLSGQRRLSYLATDSANPANTAGVSLLVTATDVTLRPQQGRPERLLTIHARGFFGGRRLYAHVVRTRSRGREGRARNLRIGRVRGACKKVEARRRIFPAGAAPGEYRVQFDTFRRYKRSRAIKSTARVTIVRTRRPASAAAARRSRSAYWTARR
jgi:hypothetical protein